MAATMMGRGDEAAGPALYLDWIRGLAALLVLATHLRLGFFAAWSDLDPASRNAANFWLFAITAVGRQAVVVFFVLSGYLVGGQALASCRRRSYRASSYFIARISRLYVVLIPALILTAIFDAVDGEWTPTDGPASFLVNAFFLQGLFGPSYGSNSPLWSLSYEWWYYALFGAILAAGSCAREARFRACAIWAAAALAAAIVIAQRCPALLWMFPLWLMGVAVSSVRRTGAPLSRPVAAMAAAALLAAMMMAASAGNTRAGDYVVALLAAIVIYAAPRVSAPRAAAAGWGHTLAAFSFTLYAIHVPLWLMMEPVVAGHRHAHAGIGDWLQLAAIAGTIIFVCYGLYLLFEKNTPWVRSRLQRGWHRFEAPRTLEPKPSAETRAP